MRRATKWCVAILAVATFFLSEEAWAWGPATHLHYGLSVLDRLAELGGPLRSIISSQALAFLYGSVSADIILAKAWGRSRTHSHSWQNGLKLLDQAKSSRLIAYALGYVSHLAADTVSHNCFVPSKTIESYDSGIFKHLYWELRFDQKVSNGGTLKLFDELISSDFSDCDEHMESLVPVRILDFSINKTIFDNMLVMQSFERWKRLWGRVFTKAPWPLTDGEMKSYTDRSVRAMMSFLKEQEASQVIGADPRGKDRQKQARQLRRHYRRRLRESRPPALDRVQEMARLFREEPYLYIEPSRLDFN